MEGTCNKCVFPLTKDANKRTGACPTDTSLTYAAVTGKLSCVKELIAAGVDVNAACECHGNGPLLSAAAHGHVDCLQELIISSADVNVENKFKRSSLMYAAKRGHYKCLKKLIACGAKVNK